MAVYDDEKPDWKSSLGEVGKAESLADVKDIATLAKNYVETKSYVGNSLRVPGPEAAPEVKKEFIDKLHAKVPGVTYLPQDEKELPLVEEKLFAALGRPKAPEEYTAEGFEGDRLADLRKQASTLGLTKKQFATLAKGIKGAEEELGGRLKAEQDALKKDWATAHDDKVAAIAGLANQLGFPADVVAALKSVKVPAAQMKAWDNLVKAVGGEPRALSNQGDSQASGKLTREEALLRAQEIRDNPAYHDPSTAPEVHAALQKKMALYMSIAYPDEQ